MKNVLIIFGLFAAIALHGQASTIKDYGNYFVIEYDHGDTLALNKDRIQMVPTTGGVRFYTPEWGFLSFSLKNNLLKLDYTEFADFSGDTSTVMQDYIRNMIIKNYTPSYAYEATYGNPDSIWYILGNTAADTAYIEVNTYSGDSLTSYKIIHP